MWAWLLVCIFQLLWTMMNCLLFQFVPRIWHLGGAPARTCKEFYADQPWMCVSCKWVSLLRCVCSVQVDIVQPTESIKEIMKMCVASLTVVQCWSSEYYGCHYQIAKLTGHVTHHPTQTAHSKQHLIACLTAHHCPLGGIWVTANGLSVIIKVLSQMSRKYTHTESAKHW